MQTNRRKFLLASSVAIAGAGALSGTAGAETSDAPAPDNPQQYDYPTMAEDSDAPVATVYGGFDCPYTADMVEKSFADIVDEFVDPGRLQLTFRALEYDENGDPYISNDGVICGQAAGGVWQEDPESFWDFFAEVWEHQPGDMSESKIEEIMKSAGVDDAEYIADNLENWDPELRETADDAQSEGVEYTPTIELKGDLGNRDNVVEWIEQRLDDDGGQDDSGGSESEQEASQEAEEDEQTESEQPDEDHQDDARETESEDGQDDGAESGSEDDQDTARASEDEGTQDSDERSDDSTDGGSSDSECGSSGTSDGGSDGSAQASQSFVFPQAEGSRKFL